MAYAWKAEAATPDARNKGVVTGFSLSPLTAVCFTAVMSFASHSHPAD